MRCYDKKNKEDFIERYGLVGNYLYILYGDKHVDVINYTYEYEKQILKKMKQQVLSEKNNSSSSLNEAFKCALGHTLGGIICAYPFIRNMTEGNIDFSTYIGASALSLFILINISICPTLLFDMKDFKKNALFVDNEEIYQKFNKYNYNHLNNVSGKAKRKISESSKVNPLDINFICNISERELTTIKENIEGKSLIMKRGM